MQTTHEKWLDSYQKITHVSDGRGDYYDEMMKQLVRRDAEMRSKPMSSSWAAGRYKSHDPERIVTDLVEIRDAVWNLLKVHGVPPRTRLSLACLGQVGKGCAGFDDIGTWEQPHIMLDAGVYKDCDNEDILDTYCGIGLHEASHLNHTRQHFLRLQNGTLKGNRQMWEGLWEDERIEQKVRDESPGFSPYLQAVKRTLFDKKEFGCSASRWHEPTTYHLKDGPSLKSTGLPAWRKGDIDRPALSDRDRLNLLVFMFIRCPYLMDDAMKSWQTLSARCPFEELRGMFPAIPQTEREVEIYGQRLDDWYKSHENEYKSLSSKSADEIAKDLEAAQQSSSGSPQPGGSAPAPGPGKPSPQSQPASKGTPTKPAPPQASGTSEKAPESPTESPESQDESSEPEESGEGSETLSGAPGGPAQGSGSGSTPDQGTPDDGTEAKGGTTMASTPSGKANGKSCPADLKEQVRQRLEANKFADEQDAAIEADNDKMEKLTKEYASTLKEYQDAKSTGEAQSDKSTKTRLKQFETKMEKLEKDLIKETERRMELGRFSLSDLFKMLQRIEIVGKPLSKVESEEMSKVEELRIELGQEWRPDDSTNPLKCLIMHPVVTPEIKDKYNRYKALVRGDIARMRSVFRLRLGTRTVRRSELLEGRLDRRQLGKAMSTDRVFAQTASRTEAGMSIGILMDESGSMGQAGIIPGSSKACKALQVGVLLAEALEGAKGMEFELYSFTSRGSGEAYTQFKYLYGKNNPKKEAIANYGRGASNYDYQAICTAADQMRKFTTEKKKLLIVVSDGAPCGYSGAYQMDARSATRKSVEIVRKLGFEVLQIAIEDYAGSEEMYGKNNVIKFTDMPSLITNMRKFITNMVKSITNQ